MRYLFLLLIPIVFSCSNVEEEKSEELLTATKNDQHKTKVFTDTAITDNFHYFIRANGKIQSPAALTLKSNRAGVVEYMGVEMGDIVQKGEILLYLDVKELLLEKEKAELKLLKAELEFDNTLLGFPSLTAKEDFKSDSLLMRLRLASGLREAEIALKEINSKINESKIRAPFDGQVYDRKVSKGTVVNASDELLSIYQKKPLLLKVELLENEALLLKKGAEADIKASAAEKASLTRGFVDYINPHVNEQGMVEVGIKIPEPSEHVFLGMNAEAVIKILAGKKLMVPKKAVVLRSGKEVVFTLEGGFAKWNYVKTGADNGLQVEILEGISVKNIVITSNNLQLAHDAPVEVDLP